MSNLAVTTEGQAILAEHYNEEQWATLKSNYVVGELLMPCCNTPAIPKTSPNFLQFFAHYSDECATSPESVWHLKTKGDVCSVLNSQNISVELERGGKSPSGTWIADVYFEYKGRRIAIEIQKSYQQLNTYLKRQEKYKEGGVEAYWLLYRPRYMTLIKSLGKHRIKNDFGGSFPSEGYISPCLPELPIAYFDTENTPPIVKGAGFLNCSIDSWVRAIISRKFVCVDNIWKVS